MSKTPDRLLFDFTGTDSQVRGSINFPADARFYARALLSTFKALQPDLLVNDGVLDVVDVRVPEGTVLNPRFPAACSYRHYPLIRCFSVVLGALARALDGRVPQGADNMSGIRFSGLRAGPGRPGICRCRSAAAPADDRRHGLVRHQPGHGPRAGTAGQVRPRRGAGRR